MLEAALKRSKSGLAMLSNNNSRNMAVRKKDMVKKNKDLMKKSKRVTALIKKQDLMEKIGKKEGLLAENMSESTFLDSSYEGDRDISAGSEEGESGEDEGNG